MSTDYSRGLRLAANSSDTTAGALRARVEATTVVVTVDATAPQANTTAEVLLTNLRRLPIRLHLAAIPGVPPLAGDDIEQINQRLNDIDPDERRRGDGRKEG